MACLRRQPQAIACIKGSDAYAGICGCVRFYQTNWGVLVETEVHGLPVRVNTHDRPVFGFHIHEGSCCCGTAENPFEEAGTHYNPENYDHPYHAGDMPPLFGNGGYALQIFLTDRFAVREIVGRTVIVHLHPDDFTTQPSGNSGAMIACGKIKAW